MPDPPAAKSKAQLKAERRAVQEAQRAAKASGAAKAPKAPTKPPPPQAPTTKDAAGGASSTPAPAASSPVEPGAWLSCDEACERLLDSLSGLVKDFVPPQGAAFSRSLEAALSDHHKAAGQLPPPLHNLLSTLRQSVVGLPPELSDAGAKKRLVNWLRCWREEKLAEAHATISVYAREKLGTLADGARVVTYSSSQLVQRTLEDAAKEGRRLSLTVLDAWPHQRGLRLVEALDKVPELSLSYGPLSSLSSSLSGASLAVLSAEAVLGDGSAVGEAGAGLLALSAAYHNVPLLVLCPTYKFVEKVGRGSLESFGPSREVIPASLIGGVVTELRLLPATAASAVFRVKAQAQGLADADYDEREEEE